jgi:hypothetical protein
LVAVLAAVASNFWVLAAPFALALSLIIYLLLLGARVESLVLRAVVVLAGLATLVALFRFSVAEALPGIVEAGKRASGGKALSHLRQVVFAEDVLRERAAIDPNGNGVGSAGFVEEVAGRRPLRHSGITLEAPMALLAARRSVEVGGANALELDGYLYIVCLPAKGGGWVDTPSRWAEVDEEAAERQYWAFAWPATASAGLSESFAADQHEQLLVHAGTPEQFVGERRPPCDAAMKPGWARWRNKQPRATLRGADGGTQGHFP